MDRERERKERSQSDSLRQSVSQADIESDICQSLNLTYVSHSISPTAMS